MEKDKDTNGLHVVFINRVSYCYQVRPFQLINSLGFVKAVLTEYVVTGPEG